MQRRWLRGVGVGGMSVGFFLALLLGMRGGDVLLPRPSTREDAEAVAGAARGPSAVPLSLPGLLQHPEERLQAKAGMILSAPSGRILSEQNGFTQMPIASLTKLMSAMIVLDHGVDLGKELTIAPGEFTIGGNLRIVPGSETVTVRDLLYASITGSANNAALALARSTGLSRQDFLREMNRKAVALGLEQTSFADPTGLSPANVGSAYDVAQLAAVAFRDYPLIRDAASRGEHTVVTRNTQRVHVLKNPNGLFRRSPGRFIASKTGYLDEALYCLVLARETPHGTIIAVTLGHPSEEGSEEETLNLLDEAERRVAGLVTPEKDSVH